MTLSAALLLSLTCLHGAFAAPTPQNIQQATCQVEKYTVERTEKIAGKTFMGKSRRGWTVVPLVSENLRDTNINDAQYNQIALDAYTVGQIQAAPGQQEGSNPSLTCDGASACGLVVTPQYVHIIGTRSYAANCLPAEPFEMYLAQTDGASAMIDVKACSKDAAPGSSMDACPSTEEWVEQVVPSDLPAGTFAKISYTEKHGSGIRYRVRFNKGNPNFSSAEKPAGQLLLDTLNTDVYDRTGYIATAHAGNWQEYTEGMTEVADFDFDPRPAQEQSDISTLRTGETNQGVCEAVAAAVGKTSGLRADAGAGICSTLG